MANAFLTPTAVTREALRVLHQKLNFVGSITREYDDSFARQGAKIGDTLKIRLPNQYVVRTGSTLNLGVTDTTESSVDLKVQTQKGVDLNFTSVDLTLALDDFSERIIEVFCSPSTQRIASTMFDLPHPFGPTTPVIESLKLIVVFSGKLLKPFISSCVKRMGNFFASKLVCCRAKFHRENDECGYVEKCVSS